MGSFVWERTDTTTPTCHSIANNIGVYFVTECLETLKVTGKKARDFYYRTDTQAHNDDNDDLQ